VELKLKALGKNISTVTMENRMEVPRKAKSRVDI
jgi:hypothetical protein